MATGERNRLFTGTNGQNWLVAIAAGAFFFFMYISLSNAGILDFFVPGLAAAEGEQAYLVLERGIAALLAAIICGIPTGYLLTRRPLFFAVTISVGISILLVLNYILVVSEAPPWTQYIESLMIVVFFTVAAYAGSGLSE